MNDVPIHESCMIHEAHDQDLKDLKGARQRHGEELSKRPTWHLMLIILGGLLVLFLAAFDWIGTRVESVGTNVQEIHKDIEEEFRGMSLDIKELQTLVRKNGRTGHR